ncbi:MAG: hypothetical protein J5896_02190 [Alphaproteobacteria bacterium]|nr:hypothetical protein [Alphaproteobacteria bacterium]
MKNDTFKRQFETAPRVNSYYAIYDRTAKRFLQLMTRPNDGCAIRDWSQMCNSDQCMIKHTPEDYALYKIGEFDEELGTFNQENFSKLAEAYEFVQNYKPKHTNERKKNVRKKS